MPDPRTPPDAMPTSEDESSRAPAAGADPKGTAPHARPPRRWDQKLTAAMPAVRRRPEPIEPPAPSGDGRAELDEDNGPPTIVPPQGVTPVAVAIRRDRAALLRLDGPSD